MNTKLSTIAVILTSVFSFVSVAGASGPVADLGLTSITVNVGQTVTFDASSSYDSDGTIEEYEWTLPDEAYYVSGEGADTLVCKFTPSSSSYYTVSLRAQDDDGYWSDYEYCYVTVTSANPDWYVSADGNDNNDGQSWETAFRNIQIAIDSAIDGDTVNIEQGEYFENISFNGKDITVTGSDPNDSYIIGATIICGDGIEPTVSFDGYETSEAVLTGLTITSDQDPSCVSDPNLISHWKFDYDPNDSFGSNDGIIYGDPQWSAAGVDGNSIELDGVDDYVEVGDCDFADQMSGGLWVKLNDTSGCAIFGQDGECDGVYGPREFFLQHASNTDTFRIRIDHNESARAVVNSTTTPQTDIWYHVFWTYDGSEVKLYVNGTLESSASLSGDIYDSNWVYGIGADDDGQAVLDGVIDDVRLYNRALSASEVAEIARNSNLWTVPVLQDELNDSILGNPNNPSLSLDGLDIYFSYSTSSNYGVFTAHRDNLASNFGAVTRLDDFGFDVAAPCIMENQSGNPRIYFHGTDGLMVSEYNVQIGLLSDPNVIFSSNDNNNYPGASASLTEDELTIVFHTVAESGYAGDVDLMLAARCTVIESNGEPTIFGTPIYLSSINSQCPDALESGLDYREYHPWILPDALSIYLTSNRDGSYAIYRATRSDSLSNFGDLEKVEVPFWYMHNSYGPYVTADERALYFDTGDGIWETHRHYGGGVFGNGTKATISQCIIKDNSAEYGGGIADVDGLIDRCVVVDNEAIDGGGIADCNGLIRNSIISENEADYYGGGIVDSNDIINCTIVDNEATSGAGLSYCYGVISNSIIWGNDPNQLGDCSDPNYCCIQGWTTGGDRNISSDPLFTDPSDPNNVFMYYHIAWDSPCFDAGDPTEASNYISLFDIDNQNRLLGMAVDIGADEIYDTQAIDGVEGPGITSFESIQDYDDTDLPDDSRWYITGDGTASLEDGYYYYITDVNYFDDCTCTEDSDYIDCFNCIESYSVDSYPYQYVQVDANTQAYQFMIDDANDHSYVRISCIPAENSSINLMFGTSKIASVKFGDDSSADTIYTLTNGAYQDTSVSYESIASQCLDYLENPDPNLTAYSYENTWVELKITVDWISSTYDVSWQYYDALSNQAVEQTLTMDAGFDANYDRITSIMYDNANDTDDTLLINRVSVTDEQYDGGIIGPADDNPDFYVSDPNGILDGGRVVGLCDLNGKAWYHMLGEYVLSCCPSDLDADDPDNWTEIDRRTDLPKDSVIGFWDASSFYNGEYLLKIDVYDDLGRLYNSANMTRRVYFNNSSEVRDIYYPLTGRMKAQTFIHQEKPDLSVEWPGSFPFELVRTYNNYRRKYVYPFFFGWSHNHNIMLIENCQSEWQITDDPTVPDGDINQLGIGRIWLQAPTGSMMFVCEENTSTQSEPNVIYVADDDTPAYITRNSQVLTTFANGEPNEFDVTYTYYARDGSKMVFDCDIVSSYVPYENSTEGLVDWTASVGIARQEDRFGNALLYTWVADVNEPSSNNDFKYISKIENNRTDARIEFENDFDFFGTPIDLYSKAKLITGTGGNKKIQRELNYLVDFDSGIGGGDIIDYRVERSGRNVALEEPTSFGILDTKEDSVFCAYNYVVSDDCWYLNSVLKLRKLLDSYQCDTSVSYDDNGAMLLHIDYNNWPTDVSFSWEFQAVICKLYNYEYDESGQLQTTVKNVYGLMMPFPSHEKWKLSETDIELWEDFFNDQPSMEFSDRHIFPNCFQRETLNISNVNGAIVSNIAIPRDKTSYYDWIRSTWDPSYWSPEKVCDISGTSGSSSVRNIYTDSNHPTLPTTVYEYFDGYFEQTAKTTSSFNGTILESSSGSLLLDNDYVDSIKSGTSSSMTSLAFTSASTSSAPEAASTLSSISDGSVLVATSLGLSSNSNNTSVNTIDFEQLDTDEILVSVTNSEYVGGHIRRTDNTYNEYGDITFQIVYDVNEPDLYTATEWDYHPKYGFKTRQTSWQGYGETGPRVETQWVFGNADGTVDTENGKYLVQEKELISETDGEVWATTSYEYYDNGKLKKQTDPEGSVTYYQYCDNGVVNKVWYDATFDANGDPDSPLHKRYYVDDIGQVLIEADSLGGITINSYDDFGRKYMVDKCIDPDATIISDEYFDPNNYCFDPDHVGCDHQSSFGAPVYNCDPQDYEGHVSKIIYGFHEYFYDKVTYEKTPHGGEIGRDYYTDGVLHSERYDEAYKYFGYDNRGLLVHESYSESSDFSEGYIYGKYYRYDQYDRISGEIIPIPSDSFVATEKYYYASGKVSTESIYELDNIGTHDLWGYNFDDKGWWLYDYHHRSKVSTEPLKKTDYTYDIFDNLTCTFVITDFDDPNNCNIITDYVYDAAGNRICVVDPNSNVIFTDYDNLNRKVAEYFAEEPVYYAGSYEIDIDSTYANAVIRRAVEYYDNDKVKNVTAYDYDGVTVLAYSEFEYDGRGRITKTTQMIDSSNNAVTTIDYYDSGVLDTANFDAEKKYHIKITDAEGKVTYIGLDAFGKRTKTVYPTGDSEEMDYNGDGTLDRKAVWDDNNDKQWVNYYYDSYGKLKGINYPDTPDVNDIVFVYECDALDWVKTVYDKRYIDNPENLDEYEGDRYDFTYDGLDNITSYTFTPHSSSELRAYSVEYDYCYVDNQKKKIIVKDAYGKKIYQANYGFDDAARLTWLDTDPNSNVSDLISSFMYDENGNRGKLYYWFGNTRLFNLYYTYNADNLLTGYCNSQDGPTFTFDADETDGIDGMGRLKNATEQLIGTSGTTVEHVLDYTYDGMGQLLTAEVSNIDGSPWDIAYTYAKDGNIQSLTINGSTPVNFGYDIDDDGTDDGDMMTDIGNDSISWDVPNGTTSNNLVASFVYDWDNKLRTASFGDSNSLEIKYDPRGNRIYRSVGTSQRQYIVDIVGKLPVILCEIDPDDCSLKNRYYYANSQILAQDVVSSVDPNDPNNLDTTEFGRYYYLHDRLGSVRMVIDPNICITDPNAAVVNTYTYQPFGEVFAAEVTENTENSFMFTGQWYDPEIAQYYLRARQYDPGIDEVYE